MEDSDSSFGIKILSKKSNNFCNKLDHSKIKAQGDTIIVINTWSIIYFNFIRYAVIYLKNQYLILLKIYVDIFNL